MHAYLTLPGSSLLHSFPIFSYIGFSPDTVKDLKSTSLTYNEEANIRYLCNTTSNENINNEFKTLILIPADNAFIPPESEPYPEKYSNNNKNLISNIQTRPMSHSDAAPNIPGRPVSYSSAATQFTSAPQNPSRHQAHTMDFRGKGS